MSWRHQFSLREGLLRGRGVVETYVGTKHAIDAGHRLPSPMSGRGRFMNDTSAFQIDTERIHTLSPRVRHLGAHRP